MLDPSAAMVKQRAIRIAVFDSGERHPHQKQVLAAFSKYCPGAQILTFPIYDSKGQLKADQFSQQIQGAIKHRADIFHFSFNLPYSQRLMPMAQTLKNHLASQLVVAAAGENPYNVNKIVPLSKTLMGQLPAVLLIGELNKKSQLAPRSSYGPELLTALRRDADFPPGSSYTAVQFTCALAQRLQSKGQQGQMDQKGRKLWLQQIKTRRASSKNLYPSINELLKTDPL